MKYYLTRLLNKQDIKEISYAKVTDVHMFDNPSFVQEVMSTAYGYIESERCVSFFDVDRLALIAVKEITLTLKYLGEDSWNRYVYEDQNGKLWKHTNCLSSRLKCIERGDTLYSVIDNSFDGEPDCPMNPICSAFFLTDLR